MNERLGDTPDEMKFFGEKGDKELEAEAKKAEATAADNASALDAVAAATPEEEEAAFAERVPTGEQDKATPSTLDTEGALDAVAAATPEEEEAAYQELMAKKKAAGDQAAA